MGDFWSWTSEFEREPILTTLRGVVTVTGLDLDELRRYAIHARRYLNANPDSLLFEITTDVDAPTIDWSRTPSGGLDVAQPEPAIFHPSYWFKWIAANLLSALLDDIAKEETAVRLSKSGRR